MDSKRMLLIGAAVLAVVTVAYVMLSADEATPPQPAPPAATQPKS